MLAISILVLLHEGGHFFFSKLFGIRVEKFYLFFDPWFHLFEFKPKKEPDLAAQVRLAFTNLNAVLQAAGCTFDDVMDVTMFVLNPEANFDTVWGIVPEFWGEAPYPTLTGIGVTWLYGFQFEIKVIAKLPQG